MPAACVVVLRGTGPPFARDSLEASKAGAFSLCPATAARAAALHALVAVFGAVSFGALVDRPVFLFGQCHPGWGHRAWDPGAVWRVRHQIVARVIYRAVAIVTNALLQAVIAYSKAAATREFGATCAYAC